MDCILPPISILLCKVHFLFIEKQENTLVEKTESAEEMMLKFQLAAELLMWSFVQSFYAVVKYACAPKSKKIDVLVMI